MKPLVAFLLCGVLLGQQPTNDVSGWAGIKWGTTIDQARQALGDRAKPPRPDDNDNPYSSELIRIRIDNLPVADFTVSACLITPRNSDSITRASLEAAGMHDSTPGDRDRRFRELKDMLTAKYGAPAEQGEQTDKNQQYSNTAIWRFPSTTVTLKWGEDRGRYRVGGYVSVDYAAVSKRGSDAL